MFDLQKTVTDIVIYHSCSIIYHSKLHLDFLCLCFYAFTSYQWSCWDRAETLGPVWRGNDTYFLPQYNDQIPFWGNRGMMVMTCHIQFPQSTMNVSLACGHCADVHYEEDLGSSSHHHPKHGCFHPHLGLSLSASPRPAPKQAILNTLQNRHAYRPRATAMKIPGKYLIYITLYTSYIFQWNL